MGTTRPCLGGRALSVMVLAALALTGLSPRAMGADSDNQGYIDTANDPAKGGTSNQEMSNAGPNKVENATRSDLEGSTSASSSSATTESATSRSTTSGSGAQQGTGQTAPSQSPPPAAPAASGASGGGAAAEPTESPAPAKKKVKKHKAKKSASSSKQGHRSASSVSSSSFRKAQAEQAELKKKVSDLESEVSSLRSELSDERARNDELRNQFAAQTQNQGQGQTGAESQTQSQSQTQAEEVTISESADGSITTSIDSISAASIPAPTEPLRGVASAYFYEPHSIDPVQVGSTSITGKDKSVAVLESNNTPFVDPQARALALASRNATRPLQDIDFQDYGYSKRAQFQSDMNSRLDKVGRGIDVLRARVNSSNGELSRADAFQRIYDLETMQARAESTLSHADDIDSSKWDGLKSQFRSEISALEGSYQALSASIH